MELRPYQQEAETAVLNQWESGVTRTLLVLPTGCGKTIVFCALTKDLVAKGERVLIMAHRGELLDQAADKASLCAGGSVQRQCCDSENRNCCRSAC